MEFEIKIKGDSGNTAINQAEEEEDIKNQIADMLFNKGIEDFNIILYS